MEENQATFSRQESLQNAGGGSSKFLWLLIPVIILVVAGGAVFFFRSRQEGEKITVLTLSPTPTLIPTPTPTPTPKISPTPTPEKKSTPTPTPKPTPASQRVASTAADLKRQSISVQILNGSGVPGAAQKAADYLGGFFYTISATGNADNYDYAKTVIKAKKESDLTLLQSDLGAQYDIGTASATLSSSSPYDAVVIVGNK